MLDIVVLISGSGSNLKSLLELAQKPGAAYRVVAVGADCDAPGLQHATDHGVPYFVVKPGDYAGRAEWGAAFAAEIKKYGVDAANGLVVSAGLMRILPPEFIGEFSPRLINTHPALLPLFPGAHAVRDALAAGAKETGITVHIIDEGVDTGPVIRQASVAVESGDTEAVLHERIKERERVLLPEIITDIATGQINLSEIVTGS
ncbi:MAG: phosphoribosylglycinamide formyltransferase [Microbacteriaceae bacterium]|nr:phosphoribosylglycinamide formyltransferase [Microbacteriaceae bacterium]